MRPAEVIGSWATTHDPGLDHGGHAPDHHGGVVDVEQQEAAEGQVDLFGQDQVLARLGQGDHLGVGGRRARHLVAGQGVAVHGVDPSLAPDHFGQGHRDVPASGAHVEAAPARAQAEPVQGGGQRPAVDVVAQTLELAHAVLRSGLSVITRHSRHGAASWRPISSCSVKVTMLLCDAAQVSDGKLYILGGGWSMTGPDPVPSAVALKIDVDWHEAETSHHWELFLEDADGQPVLMETPDGTQPVEVRGEFTVSQPREIPEGSPIDVALAVNLGPIPLAPATRFAWRLTIDGESLPGASLGFTTRPRPACRRSSRHDHL